MIPDADAPPPPALSAASTFPWGWLLAAYWPALFVATHLPPSVPVLPGERLDKVAHFTAYGLLSLLMACYWQSSAGRLGRDHLAWIVALCAAFGILDEALQLVVDRHASLTDWIADAAGAVAGVLVFKKGTFYFFGENRMAVPERSAIE